MEKDVAIINIERYNQLRDFEKNVLENKTMKIQSSYSSCVYSVVTEDNIIKDISSKNEELKTSYNNVYSELREIRAEHRELNDKYYLLLKNYNILKEKEEYVSFFRSILRKFKKKN